MKTWLALLLLSTSVFAVSWESGGRRFVAADALYQSNPSRLQTAANQLADHLNHIHQTYFPETVESVTIVFDSTAGVDALFYPAGTYSGALQSEIPTGPIIAFNVRNITNQNLWRLVGHEYFHAIHHQTAPDEESWVKEGLAQKFEKDVYNGTTHSHVRAALSESMHPLEEAFNVSEPSPERYGNTFLFFHYMEESCGTENVWRLFLETPAGNSGRATIQSVLDRIGSTNPTCQTSRALMTQFVLAKLINQRIEGTPRALWPQLAPMAPMRAEAQALAGLSRANLRRFLRDLPSFQGLKLPMALWTPPVTPEALRQEGIEAWVLESAVPLARLRPWNGAAGGANAQVILIKTR